ncbi:unnamed protein product [Paramecium sonneborni]|uniref:Uncharacterized protein n=1 Tax=Paramecium sonneborni TaxID=65129 RepID=A0A8S1JZ35_9CILI|nr:unnamed protein product [Paramecium sonneborni]
MKIIRIHRVEQAGNHKNVYMKEKGTLQDKQIQQVFLDEQGKEYHLYLKLMNCNNIQIDALYQRKESLNQRKTTL